ncbi:MAG: excisionase family DNA-binding protein [Nitriliruptoraceae bacterium]
MGIRQQPSGAFQVRFQHRHVAYAATFPTRELAEDAEPLLRAAAIAGGSSPIVGPEHPAFPPSTPTARPSVPPTPDQVRASSVAAAALLGVSRPTFVAWLDAGRIPHHRVATHRRVHRGDALAYRDRLG